MTADGYWNHNTAFHDELIAAAPGPGGSVLDIGCGDGLLLQKFTAARLVGIDPDPVATIKARARLSRAPDTEIITGDFLTDAALSAQRFDLITCVATLHHMPLADALQRMRDLLAPGGRLRIVGLAANKTVGDWIISGAQVIPMRVIDRVRGSSAYPDMVTADARDSLREIRTVATRILPACRVRRRLYYRYSIEWEHPTD